MADYSIGAVMCGLLLVGNGVVCAAEEEVPDIEFLEYLGMWEESDEDWLLLEGTMAAEVEEGSDSVPQGEESTEEEDES
ncbi:MAG: hypothetical protein WBM76_01815 [Woeseiaceae bacterium]